MPAGIAALTRETAKPLEKDSTTDNPDVTAAARQIFSRDGALAANLLQFGGTAHPQFDALYEIASDAWTPDDTDAPLIALQTAPNAD